MMRSAWDGSQSLVALQPFALFGPLAADRDFRMPFNKLGALHCQAIPGRGHLQELRALFAFDPRGQLPTLHGVLPVLRRFFHSSPGATDGRNGRGLPVIPFSARRFQAEIWSGLALISELSCTQPVRD